jgi:hypothetical protein
VDLGLRTCGRGTCAPRDQQAVDLSGYVALEAADDLSLALAFLCAPRATYSSCVRGSRRIRARQIMYSARLASRFPPRLRRCLTTLPEEASMGETPQRLANEASLFNLLGLSSRPRSGASRRCRYRCPARRPTQAPRAPPADRGAPLTRRSPQRGSLVAAGHRTQREFGGRGHVTRVTCEAEACGHPDEFLRRESA